VIDFLSAVVRASLRGTRDGLAWPADPMVIDAAWRHGVLMQLHDVLPSIAGVPDDARARVQELVRAATRRMLLMTGQLRSAVDAVTAAGIDVLPVKGPLLAEMLYGNPAARGALADLDLVVRRRDFDRAMNVLIASGYERREHFHDHHDHAWEDEANLFPSSPAHPCRIELHSVLGAEPGLRSLDVDDVFARSEWRTFAGTPMRAAAAEDTLLYLCIHGSQHMWSRLQWVADVAALIVREPSLDWSAIARRADELHARRRLALGLHLAHELFGVGSPLPIARDVRGLVPLVRAQMQLATLGSDPSRMLVFRSDLAVRETLRQRVAYLASILRPNPVDRAMAPRGFAWLVRPVRIVASALRRRM
jgi:hypothetical protein